ncbi:MAG: glucose-1-phosphate cytidylyltransferase [bacterium]
MKVVILCGGKGTRLREETEYRPKPMLPIGNRPILWHIMKTYSHFGHREFILCLGYKGEVIREYFRNYLWNTCDTTLMLGRSPQIQFHDRHDEEDWSVTMAQTGEESMTAYRVKQVERFLNSDDHFLLTYGDGVADVDVNAAIAQHKENGKVCTLTAVHPPGRFGEVGIDKGNHIHSFNEKPQTESGYINGGYMVCSRAMFDYLPNDPGMMLEQDPMKKLTAEGKLGAYCHKGFWQPMDTFQEFNFLNNLWNSGKAPWKVWK